MERAALTILLDSHDSTHWRRSDLGGDESGEVRWLPVLDLHGYGLFVGLRDSGDWVIESLDGLAPLASEDGLDALLDGLFHPRQEIIQRVQDGIAGLGLPGELADTFPFVDLVAYALGFSPFYADLALDWIEAGPGREVFLPLLARSDDDDEARLSVEVRRRAESLYQQIRRESGGKVETSDRGT